MAICPYCGATINAEKDVRIKRLTQVRDVDIVSCASCDKILGID